MTSQKVLATLIAVIETQGVCGFHSEAFATVVAERQTANALAPVVPSYFPSYVLWAVQRVKINSQTEVGPWLADIGVELLKRTGIAEHDICKEQAEFLCEFFSSAMKLPTQEAAMAHAHTKHTYTHTLIHSYIHTHLGTCRQ